MTFDALSEHIGQSLIILATMEALNAIITVLFYVTLATFIVYLIGVWRLYRAEDGLSK